MKRIAMLATTIALALAGCMEPHILGTKDQEPRPPAKATTAPVRTPAVTADKVTEATAHAMAAALKAEIDRDAAQENGR